MNECTELHSLKSENQIRENEQFIDSVGAPVQGAENGQTFIHGITLAVEHLGLMSSTAMAQASSLR